MEPEVWKRKYLEEGWGADLEEATRFERQIAQSAEDQFKAEVESKRFASEANSSAKIYSSVGKRSPGTNFQQSEDVPMLSDDEELYPSPSLPQPDSQLESLEYSTSLVTSDWKNPRLNWVYLYKNRQKLEYNWLKNKSTAFQIPPPEFPRDGHRECIYTLQYSSNFVVTGSRDRTIRIFDFNTRRLARPPLKGHDGSVLCLQFDESSDEDIIISGSSDASIILWKFSTGQIVRRLSNAHRESVLNLRFNKKYLVTCSKDRCIKVWNRCELTPHHPDYPYSSRLLFGNDRVVKPCFNVQDPRMYGLSQALPIPHAKPIAAYTNIHVFSEHTAAVNSIQLHNDEIVSASGDRTLKIFNIREGGCEATLVGHTKGIACVQYDGEHIVSGSSDCSIRIYNRKKELHVASLEGHRDLVRTVQARISNVTDGMKRIVSGSYDEDVRVWRFDGEQWFSGCALRQNFLRIPYHPPRAAAPSNPNAPTMNATTAALPSIVPQAPADSATNPPATLHPLHTAMNPPTPLHSSAAVYPVQNPGLPQPVAMPPPLAAQLQNRGPVLPIRVFKLQFDARLIICCSQDSRIGGWDFAMGDPGIIESSRFFR